MARKEGGGMDRTDDGVGRTAAERAGVRRYVMEIGSGVIAFAMLFLVLPQFLETGPHTLWGIVVALLPLLPVGWIAVAVIRHVRRVDELFRALFVKSAAVGFMAAMLIALTIAFLRPTGVHLEYSEWWIFVGGMGTWGIGAAVLSLRAGR